MLRTVRRTAAALALVWTSGAFASPTIEAHLSYRMPPRYGLDRNGDRVVDLPNSTEYVYNIDGCGCEQQDCAQHPPRFNVELDASRTVFGSASGSAQPLASMVANAVRSPSNPGRLADVVLRLVLEGEETSVEQKHVGADLRRSASENPKAYRAKVSSFARFSVCVPEGRYRATLTAEDVRLGTSGATTEEVVVEDVLIVVLGDSFASGEGAPEARVRATWNSCGEGALLFSVPFVLWADDGAKEPLATRCGRLAGPGIPNWATASEIQKNHYRYHRSSFAAASQAALLLEARSDRWSVTFVNLAQSGARTDIGMLAGFGGIASEPMAACCPARGQIAELQRILYGPDPGGAPLRGRTVDALVMSIGGNDAGFAPALAALVARDDDTVTIGPSFGEIGTAVRSGAWAEIENQQNIYFQSNVAWSDIRGLDRLAASLGEINDQLSAMKVQPRRVFATEYPSLGKTGGKPSPVWCRHILNGLFPNTTPGGLEINSEEIAWSYDSVLGPLNATIQSASASLGWRYVSGLVALSEPHGVCSDRPYAPISYAPRHPIADTRYSTLRWFRGAQEASDIQIAPLGEASGTVHPNELGMRVFGDVISDAICSEHGDSLAIADCVACRGQAMNCDGKAGNLCERIPAITHTAGCSNACAPGWTDCDGVRDETNWCEANVNADRRNCGACGHQCPSNTVCRAGACSSACAHEGEICMSADGDQEKPCCGGLTCRGAQPGKPATCRD